MTKDTEKCLHLGIQYFADEADPQEEENRDENAPETGEGDNGLPKTQEELNALMQKRLKRERKKWEREAQAPAAAPKQPNQPVEQVDQPPADNTALNEANRALLIAKAQLEAYKSGVAENAVEDAVALAVMRAEREGEADDEGVRDALKEVLKRHPEWNTKKKEDGKNGFKVGVDPTGSENTSQGKGLPKGKVIF